MIAAPAGVKIMVATKPVDFRTDGLVALASNSAMIRAIFVFRSKRADL
jgi:transposase